VFTSSIDCLLNPRDLFKEIYRVLKPGGKCFVSFSSSPDGNIPVQMWTTMNDEQKIWITGSYFHYSAGDGWVNIEGFDLFNSTGSKEMEFKKENEGEGTTAFVVSAEKLLFVINATNPLEYINNIMLGAKNLETDDRLFVSNRLATDYMLAGDDTKKQEEVLSYVERVTSIYVHLREVKALVIPSPIKAMLAVLLAPKWDNTIGNYIPLLTHSFTYRFHYSIDQINALRCGLGLNPSDEYWKAVSSLTAGMIPRNKIIFLANIIPLFGKNQRINDIPSVLSRINEAINMRVNSDGKFDQNLLQSYASDLLVTDYLLTESSVDRITRYLNKIDNLDRIITAHTLL
jgi:hypothetical protein